MQEPARPVRFELPDDGPDPGQPADGLSRGAAFLVEAAIWSALQIIIAVAAGALASLLSAMGKPGIGGLVFMGLSLGVPLVVQAWLEAVPQGQSYGKHLMRVAVVGARTGQPGIGAARSLARQLAKLLSGVPLGIGFLWMFVDPQRRTWHDLLTGTRVVRVAQDRVLDPATFLRRARVPSVTTPPPFADAPEDPDR